ncbi:MAG: hypothetical protein NTX72_00640 [Candidatus Uhrbacteria bacterium]|nr:hypothetical protein [Candidatus Uhrbacteria bacterium]
MKEVLPRTKSFNMSPPIRICGGHLLSLRAPFGTMMAYADVQDWNPHNIVAFGQNGATPGRKKMDIEAHMIVVVSDQNMADVAGSIDKTILDGLLQDGFDYANMVAGFANGVQLMNFGEAFAVNPYGEYITDAFFRTFFNHANQLKWSEDSSHVLLLIGRGGDRTLCAKIVGRKETYKMLPSPYAGVVESRHALVGRNILLTAEFDRNMIYGIEADSLVDYLTEPESVLVWAQQKIGYGIEDLAVVDGSSDTIILTLTDGEFRLVPMLVRFMREDLVLSPSTAEGIRITDLDGEILSPVVRIARNGQLILADRHSGSTLVRFDRPATFGPKFENMVACAITRRLSAHHPVIGI